MKESTVRTELQIRVLALELACYILTFVSIAGIVTSIDILLDQVEILEYLGVEKGEGSDIAYLLETWQRLGLPDKAIAVPVLIFSLMPLVIQNALEVVIKETRKKLDR